MNSKVRFDEVRLYEDCRRIAVAGERLSNKNEERCFKFLTERFEKAGGDAKIFRLPIFVSLPRETELIQGEKSLKARGTAMTMPVESFETGLSRCGKVTVTGKVKRFSIKEWDDFRTNGNDGESQRLAGKIILFEGLADLRRIRDAAQFGAAAVIFNTGSRLHPMISSDVWGSPSGADDWRRYTTIPSAAMASGDAEKLLEDESATLTLDIESRWVSSPFLEVRFGAGSTKETYERKKRTEFDDDPEPTPLVLLTGHIDSWGDGALDNASGLATMVAVVEEVQKRLHGQEGEEAVHFAAEGRVVIWSGHSHGRYAGSAAYCEEKAAEIAERGLVHFNVDCLGAKNSYVDIKALPGSNCLRHVVREALRTQCGEEMYDSDLVEFNATCDQSFLQLGLPSLFSNVSKVIPDPNESLATAGLSGDYGPYWHSDDDTIEGIDPVCLKRDAELVGNAVLQAMTKGVGIVDIPTAMLHVYFRFLPLLKPFDELAALAGDRKLLRDLRKNSDVEAEFGAALMRLADVRKVFADRKHLRDVGSLQSEDLDDLKIIRLARKIASLEYGDGGSVRFPMAGGDVGPSAEAAAAKLSALIPVTKKRIERGEDLSRDMTFWSAVTAYRRGIMNLALRINDVCDYSDALLCGLFKSRETQKVRYRNFKEIEHLDQPLEFP